MNKNCQHGKNSNKNTIDMETGEEVKIFAW